MKIIDKRLNYGRAIVKDFLFRSMPFSKVLDIGAGNGADLMTSKQINNRATLYAIDYYKPNLKSLKDKGIKSFNINIECEKIPLPNSSIDIVIANQIFEHIKEIFWVWHEISRVLKKEGNLIIGAPNLASLHNRLLLFLDKQPTCIQSFSAHIRGYTLADIIQFQEKCWGGYKLLDFKGANFYPFPPEIAVILSKLFPQLAVSIFILLKKEKEYKGEFIKYLQKTRLETNFIIPFKEYRSSSNG